MQQQDTNKPVLVFLHYFGGAGLSWQWVTELLPSYYCITPDLPGFGGTTPLDHPSVQDMAKWVLDEIKKQAIERYILIGHSMGGKIAVQMAAYDQQAAIQQLILVAPSPPSVEPIPTEEKQRMLRHPDRHEAEITVQKSTICPLAKGQHLLAIETQLLTDNNTWNWWITQGTTQSIEDQLAYVHVPVTVLASEDDPSIKFDTIQQSVMAVLPGAKLITTKQVGHLSPMEAHDWVVEQIEQVVSSAR